MIKRGETNYILSPQQFQIDASLANLAARYGDALEKHYPGWMWAINPDQEGGVIYIYSLRLSGEYGIVLRTGEVQDDAHEKAAIMAGGEILDRYNLPRKQYNPELLRGKITDLRGNYIPDITDQSSTTQKQARDRDLTKAINEGKAEIQHRDTKREDGTVYREVVLKVNGDDDGGQ
jgi:hypothetical protein